MNNDAHSDDDSSADEIRDRNWRELLQELRVTQTGVQILAGFLVTLPFQQRFASLEVRQKWIYGLALAFGIGATMLLIAPVSSHRLLFRHHDRQMLLTLGNRLAKAGLAALGITMTLVLMLVFSMLVNFVAGIVAAVIAVAIFVIVWVALPLGVSRSGS
ncbi:DUF6328 family protein [Rudaeicoccus suwonensis]|nr:DUF6328 family protein [Rudaeicoccus suwonensis]